MILDFRPRLENHGKDCRWQRRMVSPAAAVAATMSASDSNFRSGKGEWFRLQRPWRLRCPRPILFFVAAKENGPPAAVVAATNFRDRFYFSLPQRRMVPPAVVVAATRSASDSILRCRNGEWFRLQNATTPTDASILDFEARLGNRCRFLPGNALQCAVILDLRGSIWESLQEFHRKRLQACIDS